MKVSKYKFFIILNLLIQFNFLDNYYLAQSKQDSFIKLFCLQSVKEEMLKAKVEYSKEIASEACECYYAEFIQTASHQDAKTKCKLETQENLNNKKKI